MIEWRLTAPSLSFCLFFFPNTYTYTLSHYSSAAPEVAVLSLYFLPLTHLIHFTGSLLISLYNVSSTRPRKCPAIMQFLGVFQVWSSFYSTHFSPFFCLTSWFCFLLRIRTVWRSVCVVCCCTTHNAPMSLFVLQVRDDNKRQHPCLVEFSKLPEQERSYNLQMSLETLKYAKHVT